jgi:dTDP-4-dehydrorhamnose reductase
MQTERWLITGAGGQLGGHVVRLLAAERGTDGLCAFVGQHATGTPGVAERHVELADLDALRDATRATRPTHVIHLAAMSAVGACFQDPQAAERINVEATRVLAEAAGGARLAFASTDMAFDGTQPPYREDDPPTPLSVYGQTKVAAERVLASVENTLSVRLPLMYGLPVSDSATTFARQLAALRAGEPLRLFTDEFRSAAWLADAARALIGLARSDATGLIHVAGPERLSRYDLVARCAALLKIDRPNLVATSRLDIDADEPRPADLSLDGSAFNERFPDLAPGPLRAAALEPLP